MHFFQKNPNTMQVHITSSKCTHSSLLLILCNKHAAWRRIINGKSQITAVLPWKLPMWETERCSSGDVYCTHYRNVGSLELSLRGIVDIWMRGVKIVWRGSVSIEIGQYVPPLWCQQDIDFSFPLKCLSWPPSSSAKRQRHNVFIML